jgi:hypothetical protein
MLRVMAANNAKNVKIPDMFLRGARKRALTETSDLENNDLVLSNNVQNVANQEDNKVELVKKAKLDVNTTPDLSKENAPPPIRSIPGLPEASYGAKLISTLKEPGWKSALMGEFKQPYIQNVFKVLEAEEKKVRFWIFDTRY